MKYFVLKPYATCADWIVSDDSLVPVAQAFGCVLSEDVVCQADIPPYTCAIRDGWAVNSADECHGRFSRARSVKNGHAPLVSEPLAKGEAVWVNTGGAIPQGADAVISSMNPWDEVAFQNEAIAGDNIDKRGSDWSQGDLILSRGVRIGAREAALLAEAKIDRVRCLRLPRLGIVATGSEIEGATRYSDKAFLRVPSNIVYLKILLENNGIRDIDCRIVEDDCQMIADVLKELSKTCDVIVTVGGTGKGRADFIRCALREAGGEEVQQPELESRCSPFVVGKLKSGCALMGLPGNPLGVITISQCVLLPELRKAFAIPEKDFRLVEAKMSVDIAADVVGQLCVGVLENGQQATAEPVIKGTGQSRLFRQTLGVVDLDAKGIKAGETVQVKVFLN